MTGKIGTDIQEGKCTWLIVTALSSPELCPQDRFTLEEHYGRKEAQSEAIVREIYARLSIAQKFNQLEEDRKLQLLGLIDELLDGHSMLAKVLLFLAQRVFGRKK